MNDTSGSSGGGIPGVELASRGGDRQWTAPRLSSGRRSHDHRCCLFLDSLIANKLINCLDVSRSNFAGSLWDWHRKVEVSLNSRFSDHVLLPPHGSVDPFPG